MTLYLYLITQDDVRGYDTYDSAVVCAATAEEAQRIHPYQLVDNTTEWWKGRRISDTWARHPEAVTATCIGTALEGSEVGVVLASFNAG